MSENSNTNPPAIPNATQLILDLLSKKSGVSVPSDLRENLIRYLSGTYQGRGGKSEDEIYAENAPTFLKIQAYEPEGSLRKTIAGMVLQNMPESMIVERVREMGAANPELLGTGTDKEWASFVGQLVTEHDRAQNAMADEATKEDFFQKKGLPSATQQYTAEDIMNLAPEAFSALAQKSEEGRPAFDNRASEIDRLLGQPVMMEALSDKQLAARKKKQEGKDVPYVWKEGIKGKVEEGEIDRGGLSEESILKYIGKGLVRDNPVALAVRGGKAIGGVLGGGSTPAERQAEEEKKKKKNMVVDPIATARMLAAANAAKDRISRQPGNPMYFEDAAKRLVTNIQQQAQSQGRNPLIDAVLRDLITKKAIAGG